MTVQKRAAGSVTKQKTSFTIKQSLFLSASIGEAHLDRYCELYGKKINLSYASIGEAHLDGADLSAKLQKLSLNASISEAHLDRHSGLH